MNCFYCGRSIIGRYYYDWAGHAVCEKHFANIVICASCGQYCDSHARDIGMGMKVCSHCQKYRIEQTDCDKIINFIKRIYAQTEIGLITNWHLIMVSAEKMYQLTHDKNTRGLAQAVGSNYTIFVYRELSRVAFAQVLAHEMLHIYQYNRNINPKKQLCEGFCNLGSYVVLKAIHVNEADAAIENMKKCTDPIYGDGFRHLLAIYKKGGWHDAILEIGK